MTGIPGIVPFIIGLYVGKGKPKYCDEFMDSFCEEYDRILGQGIIIDGEFKPFKIRAFICDLPA